jgi:hypothetical protein
MLGSNLRLSVAVATAGLLIAGSPAAVGQSTAPPVVATSGALVIGGGGQSQSMTQSTQQGSTQQLDTSGTGAVTVGNPSQLNGQAAETHQAINQLQTGTFVVFGGALTQSATEAASTTQLNDQNLSGYFLVGSPSQTNKQGARTNQAINQVLDGTFVVLGDPPADPASQQSANNLAQCGLCADAIVGSSGHVVGGDLVQSGNDSEDYGTYVVFGNLVQSFQQTNSITETNDQALAAPGSVIVGSPAQNNNQQADTNQNINQRLTGIFVVFGFLTQSAGETATTVQVNHQH